MALLCSTIGQTAALLTSGNKTHSIQRGIPHRDRSSLHTHPGRAVKPQEKNITYEITISNEEMFLRKFVIGEENLFCKAEKIEHI